MTDPPRRLKARILQGILSLEISIFEIETENGLFLAFKVDHLAI